MELIYKTVMESTKAEIEEKKSKFIGTIFHIENEEEATNIINMFHKKYWDATHNCYAYVLGYRNEVQRYNDDGEPSGTAGMPILEVIKGSDIKNILVIVTRYFGGTLLGTGGLVRAYTDCTKAVIDAANIEKNVWCSIYKVTVDYTLAGKLQYLFSTENIMTIGTEYTDSVTIEIAIEKADEESYKNKILDITNAKVSLINIGEKYIKK
ncbi:MAG: yigZ [Clostridiales bacterium]|jgi:uncharacterized YigZ family protein|nr:yigZ [Clostridiales bacterium]